MLGGRRTELTLNYINSNDTITFHDFDSINENFEPIDRLVNAKLIRIDKNMLYDLVSKYTYFKRKKSIEPGKYLVYEIDDRIYKLRLSKVNSYGLVKRSYKPSKRIIRIFGEMDIDKIHTDSISGFDAFKSFGFVGANGVIKIEQQE